ncbi:SMARCA1 [Cordylochernes scorpioides]|uniref:SMARCA1 n=1 Tax=Cordylochernes scorpioides TaxID=51811 RepID=A0ABY6K1W8_9ARAC|nr:SMARCA1 [Cordylochernes scorpioides]
MSEQTERADLLKKLEELLQEITTRTDGLYDVRSANVIKKSTRYITGGTLREYQVRGLGWMIALYERNLNGILADEMGLGKTLQTISFLGYLKHYKKINGPFLVVVPKSTLENWLNEFKKWCPSLRVESIKGNKNDRQEHIHNVIKRNQWDVCITSYEMVNIENSLLRKYYWRFLAVDEAHRLKNEKSMLVTNLRNLKSANRLLITGHRCKTTYTSSGLSSISFYQTSSTRQRISMSCSRDQMILKTKKGITNVVMELRKVCNHPYLIEGVDNSSRVLDILEDYLRYRDHSFCRLDGQTSFEDRNKAIEDYNMENSTKFVFLLSTRAGGLGINLTSADVVILYDSDWNPQMDLQAMDRAHRIGQTKTVKVYRFVTRSTVEDLIIQRAEVKRRLDFLVIQKGRKAAEQMDEKGELLSMLRHQVMHINDSVDDDDIEQDIDEIIANSEKIENEMKEDVNNLDEDGLTNFTFDSGWEMYKFEGVDYKEQNDKKENETNQDAPQNEFNRERRSLHSLIGHKYPEMPFYRFYPKELEQLKLKEENYFAKKVKKSKDAKENSQSMCEQTDSVKPLTRAEEEKRDELLSQGEKIRENYAEIVAEVKTKTTEEIVQYSEVFWNRIQETAEGRRIMEYAEKAEDRLSQRQKQLEILAQKISKCKFPLHTMKIKYGLYRGKLHWTETEDRALLCGMHVLCKNGELDGAKIHKYAMDKVPFDFELMVRTPEEIKERCLQLLNFIEREAQEVPKKSLKRKSTRSSKPLAKKPRLSDTNQDLNELSSSEDESESDDQSEEEYQP